MKTNIKHPQPKMEDLKRTSKNMLDEEDNQVLLTYINCLLTRSKQDRFIAQLTE